MAQFDLHEIAFPTLTDEQIAQLGSCTAASLVTYAAGDVLVHVGDRDFKFFVVRSGEIEILDQTGETPTTIAVHGRGEFTGDVSHLTGHPGDLHRRRAERLRGLRHLGRRSSSRSSTSARISATSSCGRSWPAGSWCASPAPSPACA